MHQRLINLSVIDHGEIDSLTHSGETVVIQYSKPIYNKKILESLENICKRLGPLIEVRFYGHESTSFDCNVLSAIPSVVCLSIDCINEATNLHVLGSLGHLRKLRIGIYKLRYRDILASENLMALEELSLSEIDKGSIDLSPIARMKNIVQLWISGHTDQLPSIGRLPKLRNLSLDRIGKSVSLHFINEITSLRALKLLLGSRENIDEVQHPLLARLEVIRVRGLNNFSAARFHALEYLLIEDQVRLSSLDFTSVNPRLNTLHIRNCKTLRTLTGISSCSSLSDLRICRTSLDFNRLIDAGLPRSLKACWLSGSKAAQDRFVRQRLDHLGIPKTNPNKNK